MTGIPEHPPHPELIRVALMSDPAGLRELFERSGMVRVVDTVPDVGEVSGNEDTPDNGDEPTDQAPES